MYSIILCGGSGTRLWPLSRKNYPKQFLKLFDNKSLLQETYLRTRKIMPMEHIYFVTNQDNFYNTYNQIREIDIDFPKEQILTEPASINTAPAIIFAVKHLLDIVKINPDEPIIELHADHFIKDTEAYIRLVTTAMSSVGNHLGTIGIKPDKADTGFGYIEKGEFIGPYYKAARFIEKPDQMTAAQYVASGRYVWNAGMYIFTARTFINELQKHAPALYSHFTLDYYNFINEFKEMPEVAIDNAISEKSDNIIIYEGEFGWNDIGSFDALAELKGDNGNPKHLHFGSKNVFVHSSSGKLVATVGVEDLVIVENTDSILVKKRGTSTDLKKVVKHLKENKYKELEHNLLVYRPWGWYEVLVESDDHKVKKLIVYPGNKLSVQHHMHRVEHWIVVKGVANVTLDDKESCLRENESTFIPSMTKHSLENPGKVNLEIVEVATGRYLGEDDIVRHQDIYNRA